MNHKDLIDSFHKETEIFSSPNLMKRQPSYQKIQNLGLEIVNELIEDLRKRPAMATIQILSDITGKVPYSNDKRGILKAMANAWLKEHGVTTQ